MKKLDARPVDDFAGWARTLRRNIHSAEAKERNGKKLRPEESSYGALRLECYRYFRRLKHEKLLGQLRSYVEQRDPGRWHRHPGVDADWVLRLLERHRKHRWMTAPRRSRVVLETTFADRCGIHSKWLLPFLYECGGEDMIKAYMKSSASPPWITKYQIASRHRSSAQAALTTPGQD